MIPFSSNSNKGERDSFLLEIFNRLHQALRSYAIGLCALYHLDLSYADDVMQEFYLQVLKKFEKVTVGCTKSGDRYLYKMVQNEVKELRRRLQSRNRLQKILGLNLPEPTISQQYPIEHYIEDFLQRAAAFLNEKDLMLLKLYLEGWKMAEIGQQMELNQSSVGVRIHRIKKDLRKLLE